MADNSVHILLHDMKHYQTVPLYPVNCAVQFNIIITDTFTVHDTTHKLQGLQGHVICSYYTTNT